MPGFDRGGSICVGPITEEIELLRTHADAMQRSLEVLQGRLPELGKEKSE